MKIQERDWRLRGLERKYTYWTMPLRTETGVAWIDRRDVSGFVKRPDGLLDIHLMSGTIFTVVEWNEATIDNLLLKLSPHDETNTEYDTFIGG
jgi:hypothetical protein